MSATLASLRVRNLALVEDILWEPPPGFVAVTGETGAGKSLLLGALKLLLGDRADRSLIRSNTDSCTVEAVFEGVSDPRIAALLAEHGAEPCEEDRLLLKRSLTTTGAGRQFVNGSPVTLALLRTLGDLLVDLHGPHDHQSLFSREQQTRLLDAFAGTNPLREQFSDARQVFLKLEGERAALDEHEQSIAREIDLLDHQVREIEEAKLAPGEEEMLLARQRTASNARRIGELCTAISAAISGDEDSAEEKLSALTRLARELTRLDPGAEALLKHCETAFSAIEEVSSAVTAYADNIDLDPNALAEAEARIDLLQSLKRKYGNSVEEVLAFWDDASRRLADLRNRVRRKDDLGAEIETARKTMMSLAKKLSSGRDTAAGKLAAKVRAELKHLGFAKSDFSVRLENLETPGPHGAELAEFIFAPNPGEPAGPLRAIASSGEISRVMLSLKAALAEQDDVPVLVFDEIDANVGGEIASKIGEKMRSLGKTRQVFCITHLPQVAASACAQYLVAKKVTDGRTHTLLKEMGGEAREEEIARMLGGKSDSALAHARTLLNI